MPRALSRELEEAGKKIADAINLRLSFNNPMDLNGKWMAFDLNDGSTKGDLYDSLPDAKRMTDEFKTAYFAMVGVLGGVTPKDAAIYLEFCREARDANLGHKDPNTQAFLSTHGADMYRGRYYGN